MRGSKTMKLRDSLEPILGTIEVSPGVRSSIEFEIDPEDPGGMPGGRDPVHVHLDTPTARALAAEIVRLCDEVEANLSPPA